MQIRLISSVAFFALFLFCAISAHAATVTLTWQDNSDNEDGFRVERDIGQGWENVGGDLPAGTVSFTDPDGDLDYPYRVAAFNDAGQSPWLGPVPKTPGGPLQIEETTTTSTVTHEETTRVASYAKRRD